MRLGPGLTDFLQSISPEPEVGQMMSPAQAMALAIREGKKGAGRVSPNPLVGCVILDRENRLLSAGYHKKIGHDHAEVDALKKIAEPQSLVGAHFYVTLEPCAHQGRTPSCARTLAPLKIGSLTYAVEDPNPLVSGKGAAILREAEVEVFTISERIDVEPGERSELLAAAEELAESFLYVQRNRMPFVSIKIATSLDGQIALRNGESQWITGESARTHSHILRACHDAMAVGAKTFRHDDPSLSIRHQNFTDLGPNKAVLFDPKGLSLENLPESRLLKARPPSHVFVVVDINQKIVANECGVNIIPVNFHSGKLDLDEAMRELLARGVHSLMLEGGAFTIGEFIRQGLVRRLHAYIAPCLIGSGGGLSWSSGFGITKLSDKIEVERSRLELVGGDLYWTGAIRSAAKP